MPINTKSDQQMPTTAKYQSLQASLQHNNKQPTA